MASNQKYIVNSKCNILDALKSLDGNTHDWQTLFVVDDSERMIGTLTDGDIRRGLINGANLTDNVSSIMHQDFKYVDERELDVKKLRELRNKQIFFLPVLDKNKHIVDVLDLLKYKTFLPVDAVLMAGGKGERLRPLTEKIPKPLLELDGKPIIDYIVEHIISYGIKNISVTVNYLKEQIEEHFALPIQDVQVKTVREPKFLGTIGGLSYIKDFQNDTVLLMNSDAITDINLEDFYLHFIENNADMSVAAVSYTVSVPYGILDLDGRNIKGILEKPTYNYYANAGIYLIRRELLNMIPEGEFFNATDFMDLLVAKGYSVIRFPLNGSWVDIGNKQDFQKAKEMVKHLRW